MRKIKKFSNLLSGFSIGIINALFGAGGGMIAVPVIKSKGKSQKEAQACTVAVILPLCILSAIIYYLRGYYNFFEALRYVPFAFIGGITGAVILKKIPDKILKRIFSFFMLYLGIRMLLR